jgi:N-acetylmuramoyl-L-alanine amidase
MGWERFIKMIEAKMSSKLYRVQVGAFSNKTNADNLVKELKSKGYSAFIKTE